MQIPRHVKGFIIEELRTYRENKIQLEKLKKDKEDIYHRPPTGQRAGDGQPFRRPDIFQGRAA